MVRQLLIHGAELEVVNFNQQTPLDCAHSRVREALHHRRASIRHKSTSGADTPLAPVSVREGAVRYSEGDEGEWVGAEVRSCVFLEGPEWLGRLLMLILGSH